jgi:putative membrane protein
MKAMTTFLAFLHHLFAFTLVACIAVEFTLIRQELTLANARRLIATDFVLGVSAALLLIVGLLRVFYFEKGADYYLTSHAFLTKLGIFVGVVIVSVTPTVEFLSWRKAVRAGQVPAVEARTMKKLTAFIHFEMAAIVVILLCAAIMARGGWV